LADEERDAIDDALEAEPEGAGRVTGGAVFGAGGGTDPDGRGVAGRIEDAGQERAIRLPPLLVEGAMTIARALPRSFRSRLAWAVADAWVITGRELAHWARQPGAAIASTLLFPVMIVLMFGYLLGGAMTVPGGGDYRDFLMPGMFAMTMVFGIGATVTAVSADAARGVTDRFRSLPMATSAVIAGRAAADMLSSAAALAVAWPLLLIAVFFPLSLHRYRRLSR
jgi:hypothetical protein